VAAYARRGIHLPMILDDVFVNYDAGRTRTACAVLRDFAKQGHQLLVFTCHEHVWQMFKDIKVDTRRIPNRHGEQEELPEVPPPEPQPEPVPEPVVVVDPRPEPPAPEPLPEPIKVKVKRKRPVEVPVPVPVVEKIEEVVYDEPAEPELPPALSEVEYWWDTPAATNGSTHAVQDHDDDPTNGWLPEPEIRQWW
jgi:hypothetical protein